MFNIFFFKILISLDLQILLFNIKNFSIMWLRFMNTNNLIIVIKIKFI